MFNASIKCLGSAMSVKVLMSSRISQPPVTGLMQEDRKVIGNGDLLLHADTKAPEPPAPPRFIVLNPEY